MLRKFVRKVRSHTRSRRARAFFDRIQRLPGKQLSIVDLGGTAAFWPDWRVNEGHQLRITLVNDHHIDKSNIGYDNSIPFISEIVRDATELQLGDLSQFDLIFSNSMLEHIPDPAKRKKLCAMIEESKKPYFIQVPNKYALIDPHFPHPMVPFFARYPRELQAWLLSRHALGSGGRSTSYVDALNRLKSYNPLGPSDLQALFPSGTLLIEKTFGLPLSLIVVRGLE